MRRIRCAFVLATLTLWLAPAAQSEMIEEIVAWVNGDVITMSELQTEEQLAVADAYRNLTGEELDRYVENLRNGLLQQMIETKVLLHRAQMMYDINKMESALYDDFKTSRNIETDEELERLLAAEGMTVKGLKTRLVEMVAPDELIRFEVGGRIAVGQRECHEYYQDHPDEFRVPGQVTIREIVLLAKNAKAKSSRRDEAQGLYARLAGGADFAELAREYSEAGTASNGGLLSDFTKDDLSNELADVAFNTPVGQVSQLLELDHGYHIIRVESRTEDRLQSLEEVEDQLMASLEQRKFLEERRKYLVKALEDAEWCVKKQYRSRLSIPSPECNSL